MFGASVFLVMWVMGFLVADLSSFCLLPSADQEHCSQDQGGGGSAGEEGVPSAPQ